MNIIVFDQHFASYSILKKSVSKKSIAISLLLTTLFTQSMARAEDSSDCRKLIKEATSLFARGKVIDASKLLEKGKNSCSNSAKYQLLLSTVLSRRHGFKVQAAEAARKATELDPGSKAAYLQLGVCLMALKDQEGAAGAFENLVRTDPTSYEAWSSLGQLYLTLGQAEKAKACAKKAACLEPESRSAQLNSISNLTSMGKLEEARSALIELINDDTLEPEFFILVAETARKSGAYEEAIKAADRALSSYPDSSKALRAKALSQLWLREYRDCLVTAKPLSNSADIRAFAHLKLGNLKEARSAYEIARKAENMSRLANLTGGLVSASEGKVAEAIAFLRKSLAENQMFAPGHIELARIYLSLGDSERAEEEASEVKRLPGFKASALALAGRAIIKKGQAKENLSRAREKLKEARKLEEKNPDALLGLALLDMKSGKIDQAYSFSKECLEVEPGNVDALLLSARVNAAKGNKKASTRDLKKARVLAPGAGIVSIAMAEQLLSEGKSEKAIKLLEGKIAESKEFPPLEFTLAKILDERGDRKAALVHFKNSLNKGLAGKNAREAKKAVKENVN